MIKYFTLITAFLFLGCSSSPTPSNTGDIFDKLIQVHKIDKVDALTKIFGQPIKILPEEDPSLLEYQYSKFSTSVDKKTKELVGTSMPFWKDFDAYSFLKKRFKGHEWIETPITSKSEDVVEEKFKVELPELGIRFVYDNQDPLRRPMWIFFK